MSRTATEWSWISCEPTVFVTHPSPCLRSSWTSVTSQPVSTSQGPGDVVYADPPYTVRHNNNGFIRFNERLFSWQDQVRLASRVSAAVERGVFVGVSNAAHDDVRELYSDFDEVPLTRSSRVAATSSRRGNVTESLFVLRRP